MDGIVVERIKKWKEETGTKNGLGGILWRPRPLTFQGINPYIFVIGRARTEVV
jgi:hypothetical protein